MHTNTVPKYDMTTSTTGCCPVFDPTIWDDRDLHFRDKRFVRATTRSAMHVPLNMSKVFTRVHDHIEASGGYDPDNTVVLSRDLSSWKGEHLFSVSHDVPAEEMVTLSGDFVTKVFEGPYQEARHWHDTMLDLARDKGREPGRVYFFYTTCPKCAKAYGKNYVVGVVELNAQEKEAA